MALVGFANIVAMIGRGLMSRQVGLIFCSSATLLRLNPRYLQSRSYSTTSPRSASTSTSASVWLGRRVEGVAWPGVIGGVGALE